ncbi:unnamed protein product [Rotaria socialis]|uniref:Uncharacterized protein n=1 Tax=Rotaria socialis TaxID=392032 RepID=A0A817RCT1_9BILA|nr:unnamed protein product [Rotaria socialis]CAF3240351.1 unnamed protein product [Rotaria socialis]CAF4961722.1 unnamed protein product [Rotaria socialis]
MASNSSEGTTSGPARIPILQLPRIPRIQHDLPTSTVVDMGPIIPPPPQQTYPEVIITNNDALRIFKNMNILFIGDPFLRTLYRDVTKLLSNGRLLEASEAKSQSGEYGAIENECRLLASGRIGMNDYKDIRKFYLQSTSTTCVYVHLPTVMGSCVTELLNYLATMTESSTFDFIILGASHMDLNMTKLKKSKQPFPNLITTYKRALENLYTQLLSTCQNPLKPKQKLIWMKPTPPNVQLTAEQQLQFEEIVKITDQVAQQYSFKPFDRYFIWLRSGQELLANNSHHFKPEGN